ncbi:MAG: YaaL family protein [Syntrophomonadaceae bacterium]|nr:YaaL family protein [Syntrophomonadaceae bacterium]
MGIASKIWAKTKELICMKEEPISNPYGAEEMLAQAKKELDSAYNLFSRAEDPDLIECAVYNLKAAEKRYDFLIKQAKQQAGQTREDKSHMDGRG